MRKHPEIFSWCLERQIQSLLRCGFGDGGSNLSLDKHQKSKYLQHDIEGYRIVRLFVCGGWIVFHCFHSSTRNWPYTLQVRWNTNPMQSVNMNYSETVIEKHIRHFLKVHIVSWIQYYSHLHQSVFQAHCVFPDPAWFWWTVRLCVCRMAPMARALGTSMNLGFIGCWPTVEWSAPLFGQNKQPWPSKLFFSGYIDMIYVGFQGSSWNLYDLWAYFRVT